MHPERIALAVLLAVPALCAAGDEDQGLSNLARELVSKRAEVERLASDVELKKTELREQLRADAQQRAELERQARLLEQELAQLRAGAADEVAAIASREALRSAIAPVVQRHVAALRGRIASGLPFRARERAAELQRLGDELQAGRVAPPEALGRLWSGFEDELRLTKEIGIHRQEVLLEGKEQLVDVLKLGMVLLYFRTLEGRHGLAVPQGEGWSFALARSPEEERRIAALFESLEKHIRSGFFPLPNPHAGAAPIDATADRSAQ